MPVLIDNMESGNGSIDGPNVSGSWFVYNDLPNDTATTQQPAVMGTEALMPLSPGYMSTWAMHTWGSVGEANGYAGIGCNLNQSGSVRSTYNATAYTGVMFYVQLGSTTDAAPATSLRFDVPTKDTDPMGGVCTPAQSCSDHFGKFINGLTTTWQSVTVSFTDPAFRTETWGMPQLPFDQSQVYGLLFQAGAGPFDFWIDDIYFTTN